MTCRKTGRFPVAILSAIFLCLSGWSVASASAVILKPTENSARVLPVAQASDGAASYADVASGRARFVPLAHYQAHGWPVSIWLRFSVRRTADDDRTWLIVMPQQYESADLYRRGAAPLHSGMYLPFRDQPTGLFLPAFKLVPADFTGPPLLLHLVYYPDVPLYVRLTTEHAFFMSNQPFLLIEGLFIGVMIAVALFNLFVYGILRDKTALWYVAYALTLVANELFATGLGQEYVWPGLGLNVRLAGYAANVLAFATFLFFARSFLQTREQARGWDRALITAFLVYACMQAAQVLVPGGQALIPLLLLTQLGAMLVTVLAGVFRLRSGYAPARFFVVAFVPSMIGVFANLYFDAFTPSGNWFWAQNGVEIGTILQATILSFSIIDRLRILQHEQHRTRSELTAVSAHAQKMQSLALFDPLTGLANRIRFTEELTGAVARCTAGATEFSVVFCDLDGFKGINDRFGHRYGDEVLRIVAKRLAASLREDDLIARLGGDEFAALLETVSRPARSSLHRCSAVCSMSRS